MPIQNEIDKIKELLTSRFAPSQIIVFGSYARGTQRTDSDIDLCILMDHPVRKLELARQIRRSLYDSIHTPLDLLIYESEDFFSRAHSIKGVEKEIVEQGIRIYG